jgi:hypothetical protein
MQRRSNQDDGYKHGQRDRKQQSNFSSWRDHRTIRLSLADSTVEPPRPRTGQSWS